jgi:hypothetical protein
MLRPHHRLGALMAEKSELDMAALTANDDSTQALRAEIAAALGVPESDPAVNDAVVGLMMKQQGRQQEAHLEQQQAAELAQKQSAGSDSQQPAAPGGGQEPSLEAKQAILNAAMSSGRRIDEVVHVGDIQAHMITEYVPNASGDFKDMSVRVGTEIENHSFFGDSTTRSMSYFDASGKKLGVVESRISGGEEKITHVTEYVPGAFSMKPGDTRPVGGPHTTAAGLAPTSWDPQSDGRYGTTTGLAPAVSPFGTTHTPGADTTNIVGPSAPPTAGSSTPSNSATSASQGGSTAAAPDHGSIAHSEFGSPPSGLGAGPAPAAPADASAPAAPADATAPGAPAPPTSTNFAADSTPTTVANNLGTFLDKSFPGAAPSAPSSPSVTVDPSQMTVDPVAIEIVDDTPTYRDDGTVDHRTVTYSDGSKDITTKDGTVTAHYEPPASDASTADDGSNENIDTTDNDNEREDDDHSGDQGPTPDDGNSDTATAYVNPDAADNGAPAYAVPAGGEMEHGTVDSAGPHSGPNEDRTGAASPGQVAFMAAGSHYGGAPIPNSDIHGPDINPDAADNGGGGTSSIHMTLGGDVVNPTLDQGAPAPSSGPPSTDPYADQTSTAHGLEIGDDTGTNALHVPFGGDVVDPSIGGDNPLDANGLASPDDLASTDHLGMAAGDDGMGHLGALADGSDRLALGHEQFGIEDGGGLGADAHASASAPDEGGLADLDGDGLPG